MEVKLAQTENEIPEMRRIREIHLSQMYYEHIRLCIIKCIDELKLILIQVPEHGPKSFNLEYSCVNPKDEVLIKEIAKRLPVNLIKTVKQSNSE